MFPKTIAENIIPSGIVGILYYAEIASSNKSLNVATYYDPVITVKVNVFNGNQ